MSGPGDDPMLDEYLKRGTEVSQRYRELDADGVPPELDRRVLDEARAAVSKSRRWMRWSAPIAVAASAVLVVSIVLETGVDKDLVGTLPAPIQSESQATRAQVASEAPAAASDAVAPVLEYSRRDQAVEHDEGFDARRNTAPLIAGETNPPVMVVPVTPESVAPVEDAPAAAVAASPPPPAAPQAPPDVVLEERVMEASKATSANAPTAARDRREAEMRTRATSQRAMADAAKEEVQAGATAGGVSAIALPNPEQWLESIRQLRLDGKTAEADQEWNRFREVFPEYPVAEGDKARTPGTR